MKEAYRKFYEAETETLTTRYDDEEIEEEEYSELIKDIPCYEEWKDYKQEHDLY